MAEIDDGKDCCDRWRRSQVRGGEVILIREHQQGAVIVLRVRNDECIHRRRVVARGPEHFECLTESRLIDPQTAGTRGRTQLRYRYQSASMGISNDGRVLPARAQRSLSFLHHVAHERGVPHGAGVVAGQQVRTAGAHSCKEQRAGVKRIDR